jgi:hypothetical protein
MSYDLSGGTMLLGAYVVSIFCIIAGVYYTFAGETPENFFTAV